MGRIGIDHDIVTLTLGDETVMIAESYEVAMSVIVVPSAFSLRLGANQEVRELAKRYPSRTPFSLAIDGVLQFSGTTDGFITEGSTGGSALTLRGRDAMKPLIDSFVKSEKNFPDPTYTQLVEAVLTETTAKPWTLTSSNAANRKAITKAPSAGRVTLLDKLGADLAGASIVVATVQGGEEATESSLMRRARRLLAKPAAQGARVASATADAGRANSSSDDPASSGAKNAQQRKIQAKIGDRWHSSFLKAELDRAGLMLWATAKGDFVLSTPATDGATVARIIRKRGSTTNVVTATGATYRNETQSRFSKAVIHFRSGGGKKSRVKGFGEFVDQEMTDLGYTHELVLKDDKCKSLEQAEFFARKKIAESRRQSWTLEYTVPGHTTIGVDGTRIIWGPDTVVEVDDDEFGIRDQFYVESVSHRGGPEKKTTLKLMRKADVVYGEEIE